MAKRAQDVGLGVGPGEHAVAIRYLDPKDHEPRDVRLVVTEEAAVEWDYVLRNRQRWIELPGMYAKQAERIRKYLAKAIDCDSDALAELLDDIARVGLVEVAGVVRGAAKGADDLAPIDSPWALMPWEFMLVAATAASRELGGGPPLTVMRRLEGIKAKERTRSPIRSVLFVASAPGALGDLFDFGAEQELVHGSLDPSGPGARFLVLESPTIEELEAAISSKPQPDVIHFAGVDVHQGRMLVSLNEPDQSGSFDRRDERAMAPRNLDGMVLADDSGQPTVANSARLAAAIAKAGPNLRLVGFNIYNSAARTAPLAVAAGAAAAIGCQDEIDDRLAELFFSQLYFAWRQPNVRIEQAFAWARENLPTLSFRLPGSGVALWGDQAWKFDVVADARRRKQRDLERLGDRKIAARGVRATEWAFDAVTTSRSSGKASAKSTVKAPVQDVDSLLRESIRITAPARLNYAILHNGRPMFDVFTIGRVAGGPDRIRVRINLNSGAAEVGSYEQMVKLEDAVHDLRGDIRLPLLSTLWRSTREGVQTTVSVTVSTVEKEKREEIVFLRTYPVTLLPPEEWADTDSDRIWLPSFVLPRDDAVRQIVDRGQKFLMALNDDRDAGFDGYQSVQSKAAEPNRDRRYQTVDWQVRALWSALVYDYGLKYINPPPTYTESSQRLRRPCDIIGGGRGTCIDLAILFAACLEYIEIHPVVFLIEGHAFPGFWRDEAAHDEFIEIRMPDAADSQDAASPAGRSARSRRLEVQKWPWCLESPVFREIRAHIDRGNLVPIETTNICFGGSYFEALDAGVENLANPREFNALLDIVAARRCGVTPIPMGSAGITGGDS
jgi:hypothetical protein